jgi:signal peptidase I
MPSASKQWRQLLTVSLLAVAAYFAISRFVMQSVMVVGQSMAPTLADSNRYLLNRWMYYVRAPQKSDIVVLRDPLDNGFSVKRIVASSGDSVYLKEGNIYVNGRKLQEPYLPADTRTFSVIKTSEQLFKCGPNQFFVLGDNRQNSVDSRMYGPVPKQNILGLLVH